MMTENADLLMEQSKFRRSETRVVITTSVVEENYKDDIYVVFSTDCEPYQDWQSLVLFHSAKLVKQKGVITRIASGCTEEKKAQLTVLYKELYGDYCTAHFTPDFKKDKKSQKSCK